MAQDKVTELHQPIVQDDGTRVYPITEGGEHFPAGIVVTPEAYEYFQQRLTARPNMPSSPAHDADLDENVRLSVMLSGLASRRSFHDQGPLMVDLETMKTLLRNNLRVA